MARFVIRHGAVSGVIKMTDKEVGEIADAILSDAKAIVPVDTGFLKNSGFTKYDSPGNWTIGFAAEYAAYVELGTRNMSPRPYLLPAASKKRG